MSIFDNTSFGSSNQTVPVQNQSCSTLQCHLIHYPVQKIISKNNAPHSQLCFKAALSGSTSTSDRNKDPKESLKNKRPKETPTPPKSTIRFLKYKDHNKKQ